MITQNISFIVACDNGGTTTWQITSDNDCVTFSQSSGTVAGASETINIIAYYSNEDCFEDAILTITATDSNGITTSQQVSYPNPCGTLAGYIGHQPSEQYPFTFVVTPSGGTPTYSYQWIFDNTIFSASGSTTGNTIYLVPRSSANLPVSTEIKVKITDYRNCEEWVSKTHTFTPPVALESRGRLACLNTPITNISCGVVNQVATQVRLEATPAAGRTIDWNTLEVNLPEGFCAANQQLIEDGTNVMLLSIYSYNQEADDYVGSWSVSDSVGLRTTVANIYLSVPDCVPSQVAPVYAEPQYHPMTLSELDDGELTIDISKAVHPQECCDDVADEDSKVDWSSFTFISTPGQTLNSPTDLTTTNGTAVLRLDRKILYTVDSVNCDTDLIQYSVQNYGGKRSNTGKVVLDFIRLDAPVAAADSICIPCGESDTINLLDNDSGDFNPASVEITSSPSKGTYVMGTDGSLTFNANAETEGNDYIGYRVANWDGEFSNEEYLTIEIPCAGPSIVNGGNICKVVDINLESYLATYSTAGGTWSASLSNPSVVSLVDPTIVDFSLADAGVYQFSYDVTGAGGCSARLSLTLTLLDTPDNDECAAPTALSFPAAIGITHQMYGQQITTCTNVSAEALPPGWYAGYQGDLWYEFTTNALTSIKIIVDGTTYDLGLLNPQVAVYSGACGALVDVGSNSVNNGTRYVELEISGLSASTTYTVRISGSNTGYFTVKIEAI